MRAPGKAKPEMPDIRAQTAGAGEACYLRGSRGLQGRAIYALLALCQRRPQLAGF
jgi:hypothetical protein